MASMIQELNCKASGLSYILQRLYKPSIGIHFFRCFLFRYSAAWDMNSHMETNTMIYFPVRPKKCRMTSTNVPLRVLGDKFLIKMTSKGIYDVWCAWCASLSFIRREILSPQPQGLFYCIDKSCETDLVLLSQAYCTGPWISEPNLHSYENSIDLS